MCPGARRPGSVLQVGGRAAAVAAGAGFSPVPFGTAGSGAAAADACSANKHIQVGVVLVHREMSHGKDVVPQGRGPGVLYVTLGMRPGRSHREAQPV